MTANELRIGNWVEIIQPTKEIYTTIESSCFSVEIISHYQPIPLTKEWLFNFGFKYDEKTECYHYYDFILNKSFVMQDIDMHVCLKFVHQLQNLFFCLCGKELTIKKLGL